MDLSVFTLFAAAYAVVALVTVTAGRHLGNAPLLQATALAAACWLVPANVVAGLTTGAEEPPGVLPTGLIVLSLAGLLAIVGTVIRLGSAAWVRRRIPSPHPTPGGQR